MQRKRKALICLSGHRTLHMQNLDFSWRGLDVAKRIKNSFPSISRWLTIVCDRFLNFDLVCRVKVRWNLEYAIWTCKVWNCIVQQFRRRCSYKKIVITLFDLGVKVTQKDALFALHRVTLAPKVWSCYVLRFKRRCISKKCDRRAYAATDGRTTVWLWYEILISLFSEEKKLT